MILCRASGEFSAAQSLIGAITGGVIYSTNEVPLSSAVRDIGSGRTVFAVVDCLTDVITDLGILAKMSVSVELGVTVGTPTAIDVVIGTSREVLALELAPVTFATGFPFPRLVIPLAPLPNPQASGTLFSYPALRVKYNLPGSTNCTSGSVSTYLTLDPVSLRPIVADAVN